MAAIKFLGASVRSYNFNIGWDSQESSLNIELAEDGRTNDLFLLSNNFIAEGQPTLFTNESFIFGGIIQSWRQSGSTEGNPLYSVTLVDPRILFDGIQLILDECTNQVSDVPNLINVYGYLEDKHGFGGSGKNEAGVPYTKIFEALSDLTFDLTDSTYAGPIAYNGVEYNIDVSTFPQLPDDYRISATSMSLMDLIVEICDVTSSAFFVRMLPSVDFSGKWTIQTVIQPRSIKPIKGAIRTFSNLVNGVIVKDNGTEIVNEVTTKYLVGGKKTDMWLALFNEGEDGDLLAPRDNPIWYFYGTDLDANLVFAEGENLSFYVDARNVEIDGVRAVYLTDELEMRCALTSQETWENLLLSMWPFEYIPDFQGEETAKIKIYDYTPEDKAELTSLKNEIRFYEARIKELEDEIYYLSWDQKHREESLRITINGLKADMAEAKEKQGKILKSIVDGEKTYKHNNISNPHFLKAFDLKMQNISVDTDLWSCIESFPSASEIRPSMLQKFTEPNEKTELTNVDKLYRLVNKFAGDHYGVAFMVSVPDVEGAVEPDSTNIRYSHLPAEAGYIAEDKWDDAVELGILPSNPKHLLALTNDDNRINAYAGFLISNDPAEQMDWSEYDDSEIFNAENTRTRQVYKLVRCEVDPDYRFEDFNNFTNPRAIIRLKAPVWVKEPDESRAIEILLQQNIQNIQNQTSAASDIDTMTQEQLLAMVRDRFKINTNTTRYLEQRIKDLSVSNLRTYCHLLVVEENRVIQETLKQTLSTAYNEKLIREFFVPNFIAVPLESQTQFYGPWISSVGTGKVEFEQDTNLVPWNFGNYEGMNAAAQALVGSIANNMTWSEIGTVEVPGYPAFNAGDSLIVGGPYISGIDVSISDSKISTSYRLSSWTPRNGKIARHIMDKIQRNGQMLRKAQRYSAYVATLKR